MYLQVFFLAIGDHTRGDGTVVAESRAWRRSTLTTLLGKYPLSAITDSVNQDGQAADMAFRYCESLGHPELVPADVLIDYFPLIPMAIYPLIAGEIDVTGVCGWRWKLLYLTNICLGTKVNRARHVEYVHVAKEEEDGPLIDIPSVHASFSTSSLI